MLFVIGRPHCEVGSATEGSVRTLRYAFRAHRADNLLGRAAVGRLLEDLCCVYLRSWKTTMGTPRCQSSKISTANSHCPVHIMICDFR